MKNEAFVTNALLRLLPPVKRARGWRLYLEDGRRLVDLWQDGGKALLGHTPASVLGAFKNTAERGLFAPYPAFAEGRLYQALRRLFPGCAFRLSAGETALPRWRPFLSRPVAPPFQAILPHPLSPAVLVLDKACNTDAAADGTPSTLCSPVILAATTRAVHALLASPQRGAVRYGKITAALKSGYWRQDGIYLFPPAGDMWETRFRRFLAAGFLLPPVPDSPLILPGEMSKGEEAALAAVLNS